MTARGKFDVKVTPIATGDATTGQLGRYLLDKQFDGDLQGESHGEMMGADTAVKGSAGYVAVERVTGTLHGKRGSFVLLHKSTMRAGADFRMDITVVPDSGTDELMGLAGTFRIIFEGKNHLYEFDYTMGD
ncbi:MAG TPA: DUF3224 domain-containing protein [Candidatus Krumholzibacteria bacterium]|nr:DUF3224 domain-containing protein [Candidatus Krumholzibacteria bacterium]